MKLNTRSRVAIDAMLYIAAFGAEKPVALASISERQNISLSYLEQLFRLLRENGYVKSSRGPGGGYTLGKSLSEVTVAEIIETVDDGVAQGKKKGRRSDASCNAGGFWAKLDARLLDHLRGITLSSVLEESGMERPAAAATRASRAVPFPGATAQRPGAPAGAAA